MRTAAAAALAAALVALTGGSVTAQGEGPDPVPAFEQWATDQGAPVDRPACHVDTSNESTFILCYGLAGDDGAGGYAEIVTAFTVIEDGGVVGSFLPFPISNVGGDSPNASGFGLGMQLVGTDIQPGIYRAVVPEGRDFTMCSWQRLSGLSGEMSDVIAIDLTMDPGAQVVVEIQAGDVAFDSTGCGTWEPVG